MRKLTSVIIFVLCFMSGSLGAQESMSSKIKQASDEYLLFSLMAPTQERALEESDRMDRCRPQNPIGSACMEVACEKLGTFGCNEVEEVIEIGQACRGNYSGDCLANLCDRVGTFGCNEKEEVKTIARACVGADNSCVEFVCNKLGAFGCNEISEVVEVAKSCSGSI
ncbi:hypothetical protein HBN50_14635 [Halobacteriovorax sp. GB3]|uniref:hypothetical protein n=1 Tax=Halobacteriovorax sp. GB3 TaxID=2719615 RepID=UPI002361FE18|nr:hypothetical protein [Halobacteriovorax sp. GB3]MDD0854346.1 hypothetical protein [Halobacteriovorax sp. GB3]